MYLLIPFNILFVYIQLVTSFEINHLTYREILLKEAARTSINSNMLKLTEEKWIDQPLDHFDKKEMKKWKMKYYENLSMWKRGGPVILILGGEYGLLPIKHGLLKKLAKKTGAAIFLSEHRYYGQSKPFNNLTTTNLKYLNSTQALYDNANLLKLIKSASNFTQSKVVVAGCSYSGNLAAWMKLLFPDLVDAAVASSAPLLAKKDFFEYTEVLGEVIKKYGTRSCYKAITRKFSRYQKLFKTKNGTEQLKKENNICSEVDFTNNNNKMLFVYDKMLIYAFVVQQGVPDDVKNVCSDEHSFRKQYFLTPVTNSSCLKYDFDSYIELHNDVQRAWLYQTCNEFGYFQTGISKKQPFSNIVSVQFYVEICKKIFGPDFDEARIDNGVDRTNKMYGGLHPDVRNVVFVNGDMDPWSALSVKNDLSNDTPAIVIPGSSHCSIFNRKPGNKETRKIWKQIIKIIKNWIGA